MKISGNFPRIGKVVGTLKCIILYYPNLFKQFNTFYSLLQHLKFEKNSQEKR